MKRDDHIMLRSQMCYTFTGSW